MGGNAIWLNPCFESPFKDADYDVSNYMKAGKWRCATGGCNRLYLPCDEGDGAPDAETQQKDPSSLLNYTRLLLAFRCRAQRSLRAADFTVLAVSPQGRLFVYRRGSLRLAVTQVTKVKVLNAG